MTQKKLNQYEAYLFDADGTLIDTTELIYQTYKQTIRRYTKRDIPRQEIVAAIGKPLLPTLVKYLGLPIGEELNRIIREHVSYQFTLAPRYLRLFPGVKTTLTALKRQQKKIALVTSRTRETVDPYFQQLGIYDYFEEFITPESTTLHKPDPAPASLALKLLQVSAKDALFIGDSRYDMQCAAGAGIPTCFVRWSDHPLLTLPFPPDYMINAMEELLESNHQADGKL